MLLCKVICQGRQRGMDRYGKLAADILGVKAGFFRDNDRLLEDVLDKAALYVSQPPRRQCKTCEAELGDPTFHKHRVSYAICDRFTHVNGVHEDTDEFTSALYTTDGGASYSIGY